MRQLLALSLIFLAATFDLEVCAQGLKPVAHEDVWLMHRLGTPEPSPDGKWIVFSVTEPAYEPEETVSDLWLVATDGKHAPRRLTSTRSSESGAAWSPDGSKIAFSASRGEEGEPGQIYVLDMTGPGEAVQLTTLATGARSPIWSPDGQYLAFESRVYPGMEGDKANAEEKARREALQYNASSYETFPIRQWDRWRDDLQTHLFVQEAVAGAPATDLLASSELVAGPGFAGVPSLSGDSLRARWLPDGSGLIFSATSNLHEAAFAETYYHLYQVSVGDSSLAKLTQSTQWSCHSAQFSAKGDELYCLLEPVSDYAYNLTQVGRFSWPMNEDPDIITASFDRSVGGLALDRNRQTVYVSALDHGRTRIFSQRGARAFEVLDANSEGVYAGIKKAGRSLVARWESATSPAEIVRIDSRSGRHTALTSFNKDRAAGLDRQPYQEFWFESSKGRQIHNWLTLPPAFDANKQYPLVVFIHGGPHSSSTDSDHVRWSPHLLAAPGYVVLRTDYTGSVGYGEQFSRNIQGNPLRTPADEILEAVDEAIKRFPFVDGSRMAATGASYGGHLVNWLQGTTTRFDTLVGHAGLVDLEGQWSSSDVIYHREINNGGPAWGDSPVWKEQSPSTYADQFATPMMLTIGEKDYRVPVNQTIAAWSYLKRKNVPGKLLVFHDANHWVMKGPEARHYWNEVHEWLGRYLSP